MNKKLIIFFSIGLGIFLLDLFLGSYETEDSIVIYDDEIESLIASWQEQVGREPSKDEISKIINQLVEEEILYREALKLGLDKNDIIIKRRLAQKLGFLRQEINTKEPSQKDLQDYFLKHKSDYFQDVKYTFTHLYFSKDQQGLKRAQDALSKLMQTDEEIRSDPFMDKKNFSLKTDKEIERIFGKGFSKNLHNMNLNEWSGPFRSVYGSHLILLLGKTQPQEASFEEVFSQVLSDFLLKRQEEQDKSYLKDLKAEYKIVINPKFTD